jgi:hypothetical protein
MKAARFFLLAWITILMTHQQITAQDHGAASPPAHVRNTFQFTIAASLSRAAPLFGPEGERCWAGQHWNPEFLYPSPAKDIEGAVFTVQHGPRTSVWVNTLFDLTAGRMQYVSFIPDALVSTIDVRLTPIDTFTTRAEVTYARTALSPATNDDVEAMGMSDRNNNWQKAIEDCLKQEASSQSGKE